MTDIRSEIIVWTINVTGNNGCENMTIFLVIRFVRDVYQTLSVAVAEIRGMRWSIMYLCKNLLYVVKR